MPDNISGKYRHFKGNNYEVLVPCTFALYVCNDAHNVPVGVCYLLAAICIFFVKLTNGGLFKNETVGKMKMVDDSYSYTLINPFNESRF